MGRIRVHESKNIRSSYLFFAKRNLSIRKIKRVINHSKESRGKVFEDILSRLTSSYITKTYMDIYNLMLLGHAKNISIQFSGSKIRLLDFSSMLPGSISNCALYRGFIIPYVKDERSNTPLRRLESYLNGLAIQQRSWCAQITTNQDL